MKQYIRLLKDIKGLGTHKPAARENMPGSLSLFGYQFRHDLKDGFPLLTTKKMYWKGVVIELLWFLKGDTNIKYLIDNNVNIWNQDAYQYYSKLCKQFWQEPVDFQTFIEKVKNQEKIGYYTYGDCGQQYGIQWRNFGAIPRYQIQPISKIKLDDTGYKESELGSTWKAMINRVYYEKNSHLSGGKGVYVHDDWRIFKNFERDAKELDGWDKKINDWNNYQLDKDFGDDGFCYSKDTCKWIHRVENKSSSSFIYVFKKDDKLYTTNNLRKFARDNDSHHSNLSKIISGERKTADGFEFMYIASKYTGIDQIQILIDSLKNTPQSRRHIITAWNPKDLENLALHPCHCLIQFNARPLTLEERIDKVIELPEYEGQIFNDEEHKLEVCNNYNIPKYYLDCQLYQRSADVLLGVPFNIASYALLTHIIAKKVNMIPGIFIHTFGDVHIYDNHIKAVDEQLTRTPKQLPDLLMSDFINHQLKNMDSFDDAINKAQYLDFELAGYDPYPKLESDTTLSTGLKK